MKGESIHNKAYAILQPLWQNESLIMNGVGLGRIDTDIRNKKWAARRIPSPLGPTI